MILGTQSAEFLAADPDGPSVEDNALLRRTREIQNFHCLVDRCRWNAHRFRTFHCLVLSCRRNVTMLVGPRMVQLMLQLVPLMLCRMLEAVTPFHLFGVFFLIS